MSSFEFKNCKKREKTVSRAYGGSRCSNCVRQRCVHSIFVNILPRTYLTYYFILQSCSRLLNRGAEDCQESSCREDEEVQGLNSVCIVVNRFQFQT
jgi:hypothetical protein